MENASPFHSPAFRLFWSARLVSAAGFWMDQVTTGWLALEVGGGPAAVGIVMAFRLLPFLLFGLIAGAAADRFARRSVLIGVGAFGAIVAVILAFLALLGAVSLWQIVVLAFLSGVSSVFDMPARTAMAVDLVGRSALARAVALNAVAFYFFGAVGAFAGGQFIVSFGVTGAYLGIAAFHLIGLMLIAMVRVPERLQVGPRAPIAIGQTLIDGWRMVRDNTAVRIVVIVSVCVELFGYSYQTAVPPLARDILNVGAVGLGTLAASASIGATLSVVGLSFLPSNIPRGPMMSAVILLWGVAQIGLGLAPTFAFAVAAMVLAGACSAAVDALQQTLVQLAVPEEQRGRAMGVWVCSIGTNSVGFMQVGLVGGAFGPAAALLLNGVMAILSAGFAQMVAPSYRWLRRPAELEPI